MVHARGDDTQTTSPTGHAPSRRADVGVAARARRPAAARPPARALGLGALGLGALGLGALACSSSGRGDESLGSLVVAPDDTPAAIDVDRAARDPAELLRAAALPHSRVGALLGPHRLRATSTLTVTEGVRSPETPEATLESLQVEIAVDVGAAGAYHAVLTNSADYGREVFHTGGHLYLRPRYGRFHQRRPNDDGEPAAILDSVAGELGAYLELLAPGIEVAAGGDADVAGRPGRRVTIAKAARPGAIAPQPAHRRWREAAQVIEASGELVLDAATGAPLSADIRGKVAAVRDGRELVLALSVKHELSDVGGRVAIEAPAPEDTVSTPERTTEVEERDRLLRGIAPPTRRDPGAGAAAK